MDRNTFRNWVKDKIVILDGATGTELVKRGMSGGVCPELWCLEHPEAVCDVQQHYIDCGSNIVYAPTFGGNRCKLAEFGLESRLHEIVSQLVKISRKNAGSRALVFGDIAPTGKFVEPFGELPFEEAVEIFRECAAAMVDGGADGIVIETMMDLQEARAALLGVREAAPDLPVIVTMTFEPGGRSLTGATPAAALNALQALGADAFGCNCSTGPEEMAANIAAMRPYAAIPLIAKPNAGLPKLENNRTVFPMDDAAFAAAAGTLVAAGAGIIGGCCGTTPEHIAALDAAVRSLPVPEISDRPSVAVSSVSKMIDISIDAPFTVIGERINPTGKKALQSELREGKCDMVLEFALQQCAAGAGILDVNMGMTGINEAEMMQKSLARLLKTVPVPLCIDSTDPETVERALRIYPGRALLNSISAEKKRLEKILPAAAKYGAVLILLPLTDDGIPATAAARMEVTEKIIAECRKYGYTDGEFCVDALIMTVSTDKNAANTALDFIRQCRERRFPTVCGLSNVSFGMPGRALLNRTFLGMAMGNGLKMAIANPLSTELMEMAIAGNALAGLDDNMSVFLEKFSGQSPEKIALQSAITPQEALKQAVMLGDAASVPQKIDALLTGGMTAAEILENILIPAITEVGTRYEKKEFFLPQLISGAEAMQCGTDHLAPHLAALPGEGKKAKIILATVKGDIHDIGKNIVGVVLQNYGFEVIDLGKDVDAELILDTALRENVSLIGLSALMTTTIGAMREVIELARQRQLAGLHFIVGGAVVDQIFADGIGAHYAADPMSAVRHAENLLKK